MGILLVRAGFDKCSICHPKSFGSMRPYQEFPLIEFLSLNQEWNSSPVFGAFVKNCNYLTAIFPASPALPPGLSNPVESALNFTLLSVSSYA